ncbi:STAS domain-containing protein [Streptomyces sp. NPDC087917]|uniref:STAS domain-containing protein n=1 Tax=Streptomyces sp. NPDC087917 TaxID=3155060 RepID=UPI003433D21C
MTRPEHESVPCEANPVVAVTVRPGPQRSTARISGELDADNHCDVRTDLTAAIDTSKSGLDLDLSALTFCDSAGLHLLLHLHHLASTTGKTLTLRSIAPQLARLLALTGTAHAFDIRTPPAATPHHPLDQANPASGGDPTVDDHGRSHTLDPAIAYNNEP